jgi:predicted lipoprotein with Yx(FWY)xxD motif
MKTRSALRRWHLGAALAVAAVALAACGSGGSTTPAAQTTSSGGGSAAATVMVKSGPLGDYLTDGSGRTLYSFVNDTTGKSTCYTSCATFWPPLTTTGTTQAGSGVDASKLATSMRTDGSTQVTYNGHPLYTFKEDTAAGDTMGQGLNQDGGLWWIVAPAGTPIQGTAPSQSSGSSGGGGWS